MLKGALIVGLLMLGALAASASASASIWVANDARKPALRVDEKGFAEVAWTEGGVRRTLLVPPVGKVLPGGRLPGPDVSRSAGGPRLPFQRVQRKTPDGRLWALQAWRPSADGPLELHFSRWKGAATELSLSSDGKRLAGKAAFQGRPASGFSPTPEGKQMRIFVFLDCVACSAGPGGWTRMVGVAPKPDGTFAVLLRPEWSSRRYRATMAGPNRGWTLAPDAYALARA